MLSEETKKIVKSTIPVLNEKMTEITRCFYKMMLGENKELLNIFNKRNQETGMQPTALANTVLAAAKNIDNLGVLVPFVKQIGYKHKALQVKKNHYPIVGKYLIKAIDEILHPGKEVLDAWTQTYQVIADIFIKVEQEMYDKELWHDWVLFKVTKKEKMNEIGDIFQFTVENSQVFPDSSKLNAGEYITVRVKPEGEEHYALRHYSICDILNLGKGEIKFAVKIADNGQHKGLVSHFLIDKVKVGDSLELSAPSGGDFTLDEALITKNDPLVLLSAGSGVTPLISMLQKQIKLNKNRPIIWIQSNKTKKDQPFKEVAEKYLKENPANKNIQVFTREGGKRIDKDFLSLNVPKNSDIYVCGSAQFMSAIIAEFGKIGVTNIHYETFGPQMSTVKV